MGLFTINSGALSLAATLDVVSTTDDGCEGIRTITVEVPSGQTKYVSIIASGSGSSPNLTASITVSTTYELKVLGDDTTGTGVNGTVDLVVRDTNAGGPVEATNTYSRDHSGNVC